MGYGDEAVSSRRAYKGALPALQRQHTPHGVGLSREELGQIGTVQTRSDGTSSRLPQPRLSRDLVLVGRVLCGAVLRGHVSDHLGEYPRCRRCRRTARALA